jgi:hypothetical protein
MDMNRGRPQAPPSKRGNSSTGFRRRPRGFLRSDALRFGRSGPLAWALLAAGVGAGAMAIVAEFSTIAKITVVTAGCEDLAGPQNADDCLQLGHERHGYALLLLGALAILMAWGAAVGRSRPAAIALIVTGAVVLGLGFARDYPEGGKTGGIGVEYAQAEAERGAGVWLELASGVLMVGVGAAALLLLRGREPEDSRHDRERRALRGGVRTSAEGRLDS